MIRLTAIGLPYRGVRRLLSLFSSIIRSVSEIGLRCLLYFIGIGELPPPNGNLSSISKQS